MQRFEIQYTGEASQLTAGAVFSKKSSDILLVRASDTTAELLVTGEQETSVLLLPPGHYRLLHPAQVTVSLLSGEVHCRRFCRVFFAKLLAFLDEASGISASPDPLPRLIWLEAPLEAFNDRRHAEYWLLQQALDDSAVVAPFLTLLRHTEAYWLVRYLLEQSFRFPTNLTKLGDKYGLSYSHFRRVCKEALGGNAKTELKNWRVARSLLDIVEHRMSLTDIALKHGYASSSHFSTEIKDIFGVSPRGLVDITTLDE